MKIGVMYSTIHGNNGADFMARYYINAARLEGHEVVEIGSYSGISRYVIPERLDFIVQLSGHGLTVPLIHEIQARGAKAILWTQNDELRDARDDWRSKIMPLSHAVNIHYSYTKDHDYGDHVRYMPIAADHTIHKPLDVKKEFDIGMVGCRYAGYYPWRGKFCDKMAELYPNHFFSVTNNMCLPMEAMNEMLNKTRVVLAPIMHCDQDTPGSAWGCPCRTFEIPAMKVFQLQVSRGGLFEAYNNAVAIDTPVDVDEAIKVWSEQIDYWLEHEEEREAKAELMYQETIDKHLYIHRVRTMVEDVEAMKG